jgi:hypothetical protein
LNLCEKTTETINGPCRSLILARMCPFKIVVVRIA